MPIVIMKTDDSPIAMAWTRPHAVWNGSMKDAQEWCKRKNENPRNHTTEYEAVIVRNEGKPPNARLTAPDTAQR